MNNQLSRISAYTYKPNPKQAKRREPRSAYTIIPKAVNHLILREEKTPLFATESKPNPVQIVSFWRRKRASNKCL